MYSARKVSANDAIYWTINPLTDKEVSVLRAMSEGTHRWRSDLFHEASLVSQYCIEVEYGRKKYVVTEKGRDALSFWAKP